MSAALIKIDGLYYRMGRQVVVKDFARNPRTGLLIVIYQEVDSLKNLWRDYDEFRKIYSEV